MDNFIQKSIIGEDINLSNMLADIVPIKEQKFTDLELEANKKETFSVVVYKKQNPIVRFFKSIKLSFEKLRIMSKTREVSYVKNANR